MSFLFVVSTWLLSAAPPTTVRLEFSNEGAPGDLRILEADAGVLYAAHVDRHLTTQLPIASWYLIRFARTDGGVLRHDTQAGVPPIGLKVVAHRTELEVLSQFRLSDLLRLPDGGTPPLVDP